MLGFPFLGAGVDQRLKKLFPSMEIRQGEHRADGLPQPLTDLIERLLNLLHDEPAAFKPFGQ